MAKIPHLSNRRQGWYIRLRIPADVKAAYNGRKEITRSLKTSDYKIARQRVSVEKAIIEAEFEKKRQQLKAQNENIDGLSGYSDHDLIGLAAKWFTEVKADDLERRMKDKGLWTQERKQDYLIELQQEELIAREELLGTSDRDIHDGKTLAASFLQEEGLSFDRNSENFNRLGHFFTKAIHQFAKDQLQEWRGKGGLSFSLPAQNQFQPERPIRLGELFEEYLADPAIPRTESTKRNYRLILRALDETIGKDAYAHHVSRAQCKQLQQFMLQIPANAEKKAPGATLKAAAIRREKYGWPRLATGTFNMYMEKFSAVMDYAVREKCIQSNPATGLRIADKVKAKYKRDPFSTEQLHLILNAPLYTGCMDGERGYNKPGMVKPRNARFWVPLIGLWTGMRLNEICQLRQENIIMKNGIAAFKIEESTDEEDEDAKETSAKTEASIRVVPIHPMLERIGLLHYIEDMATAGHDRIFPELRQDYRGHYSRDITRWFANFLKNIGAKTKRTNFHSFRHNYRDALRETDINHDIKLQLGGWSDNSANYSYGQGASLKKLHQSMKEISYPEVDFSHLYFK